LYNANARHSGHDSEGGTERLLEGHDLLEAVLDVRRVDDCCSRELCGTRDVVGRVRELVKLPEALLLKSDIEFADTVARERNWSQATALGLENLFGATPDRVGRRG
jgi:hypothetical protein